MVKKKYNILKAASWYTIGNILINGVGFFVLPIFTRLMSTHEYGIYSVYSSYLNILSAVIMFGLSSTIAIAKYAKEVEFETYFSSILLIPLALTGVCVVIINGYIWMLGDVLSMDARLWNCLLISAMCAAACGIIGARLVLEGRYTLYMAYSGIHTIGNVALSLLLCYTVYRTENIHLARVYGSTTAAVISAVFLVLATKTRIRINKNCVKYSLVWGIPLLFHTLATVVLMQSDRILIRYMDTYSSAGIYAVATTIVAIPMVLQQSFNQAWTPWFYGKLEAKDYKQIRWLNDRYIVLYGVIIAGFMILGPDVIRLFTEKSYWSCIFSLLPLAISVFAELIYSIPVSVESYNKKTTYIMTATLITVVINIVLDVFFIKTFGYHGAAYATALSKLILFLIHVHFSRKLDKNAMFSGKVVVLCILVLAMLNIVIITTMDLVFIRYIILATVMILAGWYTIKNREAMLSKLREK